MEILAILKPVKLSLNWGWDFSSELQCSTYFSDVFSLFSLFRTHIATTENSVWAIILCHGPAVPKKWNSLKPHENGLYCHRWPHQLNIKRGYLNWHTSLLGVCHILLEQFLPKAYGRNYHNHLGCSLPEQPTAWSTDTSQENHDSRLALHCNAAELHHRCEQSKAAGREAGWEPLGSQEAQCPLSPAATCRADETLLLMRCEGNPLVLLIKA